MTFDRQTSLSELLEDAGTRVEKPIFVKRCRLTNFKSFEDIDVDFSDFNVLVGANNAGKSTILLGLFSFFEFLRQFSLKKGSSGLSLDDAMAGCDVSFLKISDEKQIWFKKRWSSGKPVPVTFEVEFANGLIVALSLNLYYGFPHIKVTKLSESLSHVELLNLIDASPILVPGFVGLLLNEEHRTSARRTQLMYEGRHTEILRNTLVSLSQDQKRYDLLCALIWKHFDVDLGKPVDDDALPYIKAEYEEGGVGLDLACAGSGLLQVLQVLTYFTFKKTKILLLDEPDAHLHPGLQTGLVALLEEFGRYFNVQIVLATHSKEIINSIDPGKIIPLSRSSNRAVPLTGYSGVLSVLSNIGSIDNIDLAVLLKSRRILFVEGKDANILFRFASLLELPVFEGESRYVIISRNGVDNTRYYDDAKVISDFLGGNLKVFSLIDRDYKIPEQLCYHKKISEEKGVSVLSLNKKELENYLLIPDLICRVINLNAKVGPAFTSEQVVSLLEDILDELHDGVFDQYANTILHFHRQRKDNIDIARANSDARNYLSENWTSFQSKLDLCSGKEIISLLNRKLQEHHVSISSASLMSSMKKEEVHQDIREHLSTLNSS